MPTITETVVDAFAHCPDARCGGYGQQPVKAVLTLRSETLQERGGDMPFIENSWEYLRFLNDGADDKPDEMPCEHCGTTREVTAKERPSYQPLSGHPQNGLLTLTQPMPGAVAANAAETELKGEVAALKAQLAELIEAVTSADPGPDA